MPDDLVPPDPLPTTMGERLDDPTEDRLRDVRSVFQLVETDPVGSGFDVPTEPVDLDRPVDDLPPV
jgi:hypothetical protein